MSFKCKIKKQPEQPVLSIRTRTSLQELPQLLGASYGAIAQYLGSLGEKPAGAPFAAYYNMDMQDLDVEIGFPVSRPLAGQGDIQAGKVFGGKVGTCLYVGPYGGIKPAYEALIQFVKEKGHEATNVAYEFYLNDPATVKPDELQTQIYFPLK